MGKAKATLTAPLYALALATGASSWLAHRKPVRRILMLHGVGGGDLSAAAFEQALGWLARRFRVVHLHDMVGAIARREAPGPHGELALTFDDGLRNQFDIAYPVLQRFGMPATFFVCPGLVESGRWLWNQEARARLRSMSATDRVGYAAAFGGGAAGDVEPLIARMKTLPLAERLAHEQRLRDATPVFKPSEEACRRFDPLRWSDLERLDPSLVTVGSHTMSHPILPTLDNTTLDSELSQSRRLLETRLGRTVDLFCYPNGANDARVRSAVASVYTAAVTTEYGFVRGKADPHRLSRIPMTPNLPLLAWRMHRATA